MRRLAAAPLFSLGFRPLFLAGAGFAALAILIWGLWLYGHWFDLQPAGGMLAWHRHEMPFGFAAAIVAGFLLTAVPNWTGIPGVRGGALIALVSVWVVDRLAWWLPLPTGLILALQWGVLPLLAVMLARDLIAARKPDNYPIVLVLALMAGCQALTLIGLFNDDAGLQRQGVLGALWLVAALMTVIGGRVIPFFIQRGLNRPPAPTSNPLPTRLLLIGSLLTAVTFASGLNDSPQWWLAGLFMLTGSLQLMRLIRWHDRGMWRVPLLWSLYLAYGWMALATWAMALWHLGLIGQQSLATHALAVGGVGGLILAMIARVSLGHTGRLLQPSKGMALGFALVLLAAGCRVLLVPFSSLGLGLSVVLWCAGFALFLRHYTGILLKPRL
ncbi:NnrS family protein [Pseudomonas fluorescens]|uniref:Putative membrane protein n=1 Tax=Pseudomonas fluorescens (strain Pf0-1) TaxID=205922 RepID=Q3KE95_PSEPF|nr:NnrS family protein [Pseudomonas fluorescens]ABA73911.1 putative membrane protein [Pseudomonas fluorescens Pf0-1]MBY9027265.1 NnrS family protein [Pseudomonas fluorescens]MBY9033064.1 NnrS family protein [Pseudomonas fluorescens]MBY9036487.1 NnrS family protein [Pseudomonas fluorescens]MBY9044909.1 NnrS family protein [Pseudomonas fluorescens]